VSIPNNLNAYRGSCSPQDVRLSYIFNGVYTTPKLENRVASLLLGNWQIAPIIQIRSGQALNVTSGLDQVYPKGLAVGTVFSAGNGNIYKTINVKPAVDLNRLEMVLVVMKPGAAEQQALNRIR